MNDSNAPTNHAAPKQLPPEGPPPRRRFLLHVPGRDFFELDLVEHVVRPDGWDFYLAVDAAALGGGLPDLTPPEGASCDRFRRFFVLLPHGGKMELRESGRSIGTDDVSYYLDGRLRSPPERRDEFEVPGRCNADERERVELVSLVLRLSNLLCHLLELLAFCGECGVSAIDLDDAKIHHVSSSPLRVTVRRLHFVAQAHPSLGQP